MLVDHPLAPLQRRHQSFPHNRLEQFLLAVEVQIQRPLADPGTPGHVLQARGGVASLDEQLEGGAGELGGSGLLAAGPAGNWFHCGVPITDRPVTYIVTSTQSSVFVQRRNRRRGGRSGRTGPIILKLPASLIRWLANRLDRPNVITCPQDPVPDEFDPTGRRRWRLLPGNRSRALGAGGRDAACRRHRHRTARAEGHHRAARRVHLLGAGRCLRLCPACPGRRKDQACSPPRAGPPRSGPRPGVARCCRLRDSVGHGARRYGRGRPHQRLTPSHRQR